MRCIYITAPNPFPALETFVSESAERYNMRLVRFGGKGMKVALEDYLGCEEGRGVRGVLMGTRKGDPNGGEWCVNMQLRRIGAELGAAETGGLVGAERARAFAVLADDGRRCGLRKT
jgi:hypothetical protein